MGWRIRAAPSHSHGGRSRLTQLSRQRRQLVCDEGDEEKAGDYILTGRSINLALAKEKIRKIVLDLKKNNLKVARYKIEFVILDTKTCGDVLETFNE